MHEISYTTPPPLRQLTGRDFIWKLVYKVAIDRSNFIDHLCPVWQGPCSFNFIKTHVILTIRACCHSNNTWWVLLSGYHNHTEFSKFSLGNVTKANSTFEYYYSVALYLQCHFGIWRHSQVKRQLIIIF